MYDTIDVGQINCPHCMNEINPNFQTKQGPCSLAIFSLGEKLSWDFEDIGSTYDKKQYTIDLSGGCPHCGVTIPAYGRINARTKILELVEIFEYQVTVKPPIEINYENELS